jgi:hypothetical protein
MNAEGGLTTTPGSMSWSLLIISLALFCFMSILLYRSDFKGPEKDGWIFFGIYLLGAVGTLLGFYMTVTSILFPTKLTGDVIKYTTQKFEKRSNQISDIDHVSEDQHGVVTFEFSNGDELKIARHQGGAEAILETIYIRLTEQLAEEFPYDEKSIH